MSRSIIRCALALLAVAYFAPAALAATRTVDAAGGGDYTTLAAAVADMNNDLWGPEPHTILVTDNQLNLIDARITLIRSVTIQNAPGDAPHFRVDQTNLGNAHIFYCAGEHSYTFEGLTFFGNAGSSPSDSDNVLFRLDNGNTNPQSFTLRNCLITANNGSDGPVTDFTTAPASAMGFFFHAVTPYRSGDPGAIVATIEDSTIAFCSRGIAFYGGTLTAGGSLTVTNTMFAQRMDMFLYTGSQNFTGVPIVFDECIFANNDATTDNDRNMLRLQGNNMSVTVTDSIFRSRYDTAVRCDVLGGSSSINLTRVTAHVGRGLIGGYTLAGTPTITMRDVIWYYYAPRITGGAIFFSGVDPTFVLNNLAIYEGRWDATDGGGPLPALQTAIGAMSPALYTDDPTFLRDTFGAGEVGLVGWDRGLNDLYDVNNPAYIGRGTAGQRANDAMTGGADPGPLVPIELSTISVE